MYQKKKRLTIVISFLKSSIGKKIIMAITGQGLIIFVIVHVLGNSSIYVGWLNAYAKNLHDLPALIWLFRVVMLIAITMHIYFGVVLKLENRSSRHKGYAVKNTIESTFAGRNMIWTGGAIGVFLIYHLLHFTVQVVNTDSAARSNTDVLGRPDVFKMVVLNFQNLPIFVLYILSIVALFLHLTHGIQSSMQTVGLNNERTMPFIVRFGYAAAFILFLGYIAIPTVIYLGLLRI
jgi:succinate dehydrogenase / fumarate reductase cytochrome b subunit